MFFGDWTTGKTSRGAKKTAGWFKAVLNFKDDAQAYRKNTNGQQGFLFACRMRSMDAATSNVVRVRRIREPSWPRAAVPASCTRKEPKKVQFNQKTKVVFGTVKNHPCAISSENTVSDLISETSPLIRVLEESSRDLSASARWLKAFSMADCSVGFYPRTLFRAGLLPR